jgi:predicted metal-dependent peptidase
MFYEFLKNKIEKIYDKLSNSINVLTVYSPYYAEMALSFNFFESKDIPTIGVNVTTKGVNCYYNVEFLKTIETDEEITFIVLHEIFHIIFDHPKRTLAGKFNHLTANLVQDMIINQILHDTVMQKEKGNYLSIPQGIGKNGKKQNSVHFIPKEYDGEPVFEPLYEWFKDKIDEEREKRKKNNSQKSNKGGSSAPSQNAQKGQNGGQEGQGDVQTGGNGEKPSQSKGNPQKGGGKNGEKADSDPKDYGPNGKNGVGDRSLESKINDILDGEEQGKQIIKTLDEHLEDEIPQELRKQIVEDLVNRIRNRGLASGSFEEAILQLQKKKKDYLKDIKKAVSAIKGRVKNQTWSRPNRKELPVKGFKRHGSVLTAIIDTSGSMHGYHDKIISYIFQNDIVLDVIQCDATVQNVKRVNNKNELKRLKLKGFGGTILQPSIDLIKKEYKKQNLVILSDGATDSLDFSGFKGKVLILSVDNECPVKVKPLKGLKQVCIKDE